MANESRSITVLIVDDEKQIREGLCKTLQRSGYGVRMAPTAAEAEHLMEEAPSDLALVDIDLPDLDGLQLCRRLKAGRDLEVILITGHDHTYSFADAMASGATDFLLKPLSFEEVLLRIEKALDSRRTRQNLDRLIGELQRQAVTDILTGLHNSRFFFTRLEKEVARSARYGNGLCLLVLDIDHFKQINDGFGHQEGDKVLRRVGEAIRDSLRGTDTCFRYGGEEFAVLMPDSDDASGQVVGERLLRAVRDLAVVRPPPNEGILTISIGIAALAEGESMTSLLRRADLAMYEAKHAGRDQLRVADAPAKGEPEPAVFRDAHAANGGSGPAQ